MSDEPVFLSSPDVGELEQSYVLAALQSGWAAPAGPDLDAFEAEVAARVGVSHAVALSSGTAGLHLALLSWGVGPGDVVPVSTLTFAASVNAIRYVGAEPFLVDAEEATGNLSPDLLEQALRQLRREGRRVPAIMPVDMLGKSVDHAAVGRLAADAGARVLCDSAESFGSRWQGRPVGSFGDASVLSFNGNKVMTTSGGGMLLTDDAHLAAHVGKLASQAREPVAHYEHTEVGHNYRLSNVLAALGRAQLTRLDAMVGRRRTWRARYASLFADQPGVRILGRDGDRHDNCWLTAVVVDPTRSVWTAQDLARSLHAAGIETRPVWKPMHLQPVNADLRGVIDGTSERLFQHGLALPSGSAMTDEQFARVEDVVGSVFAARHRVAS